LRAGQGWPARLIALTLLWLAAGAQAAGLTVTPVSLRFAPADTAHGLWLTNSGSEPLHAQLRLFRWSQADGADRLQPTQELALSPPILELQPGQQQLVRVIRLLPAGAAEQSYRILIDELPDPARPLRNGLNFVMQFSVPVFAAALQPPAPPQLSWQLDPGDTAGGSRLRVENRGGLHAQITDLELRDAAGRVLLAQPGLLGYALAASGRSWPLDLPAAAVDAVSELQLRINGQISRQPLRANGAGR
jgi:fimbrial chaperone protein